MWHYVDTWWVDITVFSVRAAVMYHYWALPSFPPQGRDTTDGVLVCGGRCLCCVQLYSVVFTVQCCVQLYTTRGRCLQGTPRPLIGSGLTHLASHWSLIYTCTQLCTVVQLLSWTCINHQNVISLTYSHASQKYELFRGHINNLHLHVNWGKLTNISTDDNILLRVHSL